MVRLVHHQPMALAQVEHLEELWEEHSMAPNAVQLVRDGLDGGAFSRASVARQLKAMGLKRGALTTRQVRSHREKVAVAKVASSAVFPCIGADTDSL